MHGIAGIRWRAWSNYLESRRDWVLTPLPTPGQNLPCPPTPTIRFSRFRCQVSAGRKSLRPSIIPDHRDPALITHTMADILRARIFAIACGYPDGDDLDDRRKDPAFKLACGRRLAERGGELASQPTMSRWENAPDLRTLIRLTHSLVDLWCKSYKRAPKTITLDI